MTTLEYFKQAELSLAAYANLSADAPMQDYLRALAEAGFSTSQAEFFTQTYSVAAVCNESNGLSATVFVHNVTGEQYLAIRGTNDFQDVLSDIVDCLVGYYGLTGAIRQPQDKSHRVGRQWHPFNWIHRHRP